MSSRPTSAPEAARGWPRWWLALALLGGCGRGDDDRGGPAGTAGTGTGQSGPGTGGGPGTGTGSGTATGAPWEITNEVRISSASCDPHPENVLLRVCRVALDAPGVVELTLSDAASKTDLNTWVTERGEAHEVVLWGMSQLRDFGWTARVRGSAAVATGTFRTEALPARMDVDLRASGSPGATVGTMLFPYSCDGDGVLLIADGYGRVRWYADLGKAAGLPGPVQIAGFTFTPEHTIMAILARRVVIEIDLAGRVLNQWDANDDGILHHDLYVWHDRVFAQNARTYEIEGEEYIIDGISVHDRRSGDILAEWSLHGLFDPVGDVVPTNLGYWQTLFPGATDSTHGNSVVVDEDGTMIVSMRHLDAVLKVVADPAAPDFGEVLWTVTGRPGPLASDLTVTSSVPGAEPEWEVQHHPHLTANGNLVLFDNKEFTLDGTRVVELEIDEGAGVADIVKEYPLDRWCLFHGADYELPSGNLLVTCATDLLTIEFDRATQAEVWSMAPRCDPNLRYLMRVAPVDLY